MITTIPGGSRWEQERKNVGPGWQPILERLHADLQSIQPNYEVLAIERHRGLLRYYVAGGLNYHTGRNKEFWDRIKAAETEAAQTCEDCGWKLPSVTTETLGPGFDVLLTLCELCSHIRLTRATLQRMLEETRD